MGIRIGRIAASFTEVVIPVFLEDIIGIRGNSHMIMGFSVKGISPDITVSHLAVHRIGTGRPWA
jgi:hypothetical protein